MIGLKLYDLKYHSKLEYYFNLYKDSLTWSDDKIENYQAGKIKELLIYANKHVHFYNRRFKDAGFNPEYFKYLDDLKAIPPLTRKDVQTNQIFSNEYDPDKCTREISSGSTGTPIVFYHDRIGNCADKAAVLVCKYLGGYKLGDRCLNIWGNQGIIRKWNTFSSRISKLLFNEIRFAAFHLQDHKNLGKLYDLVERKKPDFLYGYTHVIYIFAKFLEDNNLKVNIKGVFTTAENLLEFQRCTIEKNIGKVYDHYGCKEVNGIAAQSLTENMYTIIKPHVYVEFDNCIGNSQKVLITSLHNKVSPFIRYENGDLATCCNGKIKSIDGRTSEIMKLPNGQYSIMPSFLGPDLISKLQGLKQYQIIKEKRSLIINLVTKNIDSCQKEKLMNLIHNHLPGDLNYDIVFNRDIILKNGKYKVFIEI